MSRQLPPRPNLEHLRKQAKDLLQDLQQRNPVAQLADAQHAVAREYGFPSWPKLRAHVESRAVPDPQSPFVGLWKANLLKSKAHPANPFQSATVEFDIVNDTVRVTDVVVDASGRKEQRLNTIHADGREHPSEGGNGYSVIATWRGSHVLETVATQGGQVVGSGTYEVSADGGTLTVSSDHQRIVLDRCGRGIVAAEEPT